MNQTDIFESKTPLPDCRLAAKERSLLGFEVRYSRVRNQLRLLLNLHELAEWNQEHHGGQLAVCDLVAEQHPLVIFHGDVGTGKTVMAECIANRLISESKTEDSVLFKLGNRVRGSGKVGEMGTLLIEAFEQVARSVGRERRAILIIDEGDSLAAARSQDHSHHEDKVAVNTLIQRVDDLRRFGGRVVVIFCTNRVLALDPALQRRASVIEEFTRPSEEERRKLFAMDLAALSLTEAQLDDLVKATDCRGNAQPTWTYSDIRTRLYPKALASAFPDRSLCFDDLQTVAADMKPSPVMEGL